MARINYEIPDDIHREAKIAAAMSEVTLRELVIRGLQLATNEAKTRNTR